MGTYDEEEKYDYVNDNKKKEMKHMVKYTKELTINTGNYNNMKVKVSECDSWIECNERLIEGIKEHTDIDMSRVIAEMLGCVEDGEKQKK